MALSRKILAVLAVVIVLVIVAGAAAYVILTAPPTTQERVLVVGTTDDEITFDPADSYDYFSINMIQNTMAMLLTYVPGTSNLTPDLLSEVPTVTNGGISTDGLTYTLKIRPNAEFEDGTPINASVVKYSIDRVVKLNGEPAFLLEPLRGATDYWDAIGTDGEASAWANYSTGPNRAIRIVDDLKVTATLWRKWSPFPYLLALSTPAPVDPKSFTDDKFYPNVVISSGPYRLRNYLPHQRYELEKNPNYYGTPAKMSRVTVVRYTTAVDLKLAMQTGAIDVAYRSLLPDDFNAFKTDPKVKYLEGDSPVIRYLVFNMCSAANVTAGDCPQVSPFTNIHIRKALAYLTNRTDIVTTAYKGTVSPLYSLVPEGMFAHEDVFKTVYGESPAVATAEQELTAAGYSASNPFRFTLWYTPSHYGDPEIFVAQALQRAWQKTSMIQVTLNQKEWAQYRASWRAGDFGVFLLGWFPDYFDSDDYVFPFLHWASGGSASFGNWYNDATMDSWIEQEAATANPAERQTIFGQIQDKLAADVPYLPLFQTDQTVVFAPNVSGIVLDPIQFFRYFTIQVT